MAATSKIFAYGTLESDTDSWLLAAEQAVPLDVSLIGSFDTALEHHSISVVGTLGKPPSAPTITKLIVEKLVGHDAIRRRAYELYESGKREAAADNWLRAERELLQM